MHLYKAIWILGFPESVPRNTSRSSKGKEYHLRKPRHAKDFWSRRPTRILHGRE